MKALATQTEIHPMAAVDPGARIGARVRIGPFCVIGPDADLADGVVLHSHVVVEGRTRIGPGTEIFPFASIGTPPQDLKFGGERSELIIGADTRIREHVTINPGTQGGGMVTRIGDGCLLMVGSHVAHDCELGDRVILANGATLAGHVTIGDHAILGGLSAVHQFVRVGAHAFVGGMTGVERDVIPYGMAMGERGWLAGLNLVGLRRRGFDRPQIHELRAAFDSLFTGEGELADKVARLRADKPNSPLIRDVLDFIGGDTDRRLLTPKPGAQAG